MFNKSIPETLRFVGIVLLIAMAGSLGFGQLLKHETCCQYQLFVDGTKVWIKHYTQAGPLVLPDTTRFDLNEILAQNPGRIKAISIREKKEGVWLWHYLVCTRKGWRWEHKDVRFVPNRT